VSTPRRLAIAVTASSIAQFSTRLISVRQNLAIAGRSSSDRARCAVDRSSPASKTSCFPASTVDSAHRTRTMTACQRRLETLTPVARPWHFAPAVLLRGTRTPRG